jgi:hypothetical protein
MRMRAPDQIRGGADLPEDRPRAADAHHHADRDLSYRLARLPSSHPSAGPAADWRHAEYSELGLREWWRPVADGQDDEAAGEPSDVADEPDDGADEPDDALRSEDAELDQVADEPEDAGRRALGARAGRRGEPSGTSGELTRPSARSPYRPWFSADGAGDPWFAVRAEAFRETSSSSGPGG